MTQQELDEEVACMKELEKKRKASDSLMIVENPGSVPFVVKVIHPRLVPGFFNATGPETVGDLKCYIERTSRIPASRQVLRLGFAEPKLKDTTPLASLLCCNRCGQTLILSDVLYVEILVGRDVIELEEVDDQMTVEDLKDLIQLKLDVPEGQQILHTATWSHELKNSCKIVEYKCGAKALSLNLTIKGWIFIEFPWGRCLTLTDVHANMTIGRIKELIEDAEEEFPPACRQKLFLDGEELMDECILGVRGIKWNDTLKLVLK